MMQRCMRLSTACHWLKARTRKAGSFTSLRPHGSRYKRESGACMSQASCYHRVPLRAHASVALLCEPHTHLAHTTSTTRCVLGQRSSECTDYLRPASGQPHRDAQETHAVDLQNRP
jgi:hypothetical protein